MKASLRLSNAKFTPWVRVGALVTGMILGCSAPPASMTPPNGVDSGRLPEGCIRGQTASCACPGGLSGVQSCGADRAFGLCACDGFDSAPPTDLPQGADLGTDLGTALDVPMPPADQVSPDAGTADDTSPDVVTPLDAGATPDIVAADVAPDVSCPAGRTRCGVPCVDLQSDPANCGACGRACSAGQMCAQGSCQPSCRAGQTNCNGACLTLGTPCSVGVGACLRRGTTVCGTGTTPACAVTAGSPSSESCNGVDDDCDGLTDEGFCRIGGTCATNGQTNPANACQRCVVTSTMVNGPTAWTETPGGTNCNGTCRDLQSDLASCGACGRACSAGQNCVSGTCTTSTGMCPAGTVLIPAGSFVMGAPSTEPGTQRDERPQRTVTLSAYCLGISEVTVAEYQRCFTAGSCTAPNTTTYCNWNVPGRENHPINCIDWTQAGAVCAFLYPGRGRLPTEAEWENAASVGGTRRFPWGDTAPTNQLCWAGGGTTRISTCTVSSFPSGNTPSGIQDLAGNVLEWVSDWYGTYPDTNDTNPTGPTSGSYRVFRGGAWDNAEAATVRARGRFRIAPSSRSSIVGVRCASGIR